MLVVSAAFFWLGLSTTAPASPGPTLATEDTMFTEVSEVLVKAPRVTLAEILDRVAAGEARRESLFVDQSFTATSRVVAGGRGDKGPILLQETVSRVYRKRPNRVRMVLVRQWKKDDSKGGLRVTFRPGMGEQIVNFAFRPEARRNYRYRILGRDLVGNHVIYRIAFQPRSPLDPSEPSGLVWVDTNDFVIVRQEVKYERSPAALFLKGVDRIVVERRNVDGYWVLWRVLARFHTTVPFPKLGRSFDFGILLDQYAINTGIEDAFFDARGAR